MKRLARHAAAIVWPAFLMAGVIELLVFAWVDPGAIHGLELSPSAVYTLAFFAWWMVIVAACALTLLLSRRSRSPAPAAPRV
jgi:hypothetical protein